MLSKLRSANLADIRNNYATHPLFIAIQDACLDICTLPQTFQFRPEHVFVEVLTLLDHLKENQEDTNWSRLNTVIKQDYRFLDSSIPADELSRIAATIDCTLASILVLSTPRLYHTLGESLLQQAFAHDNDIPREPLFNLCDTMEAHADQLLTWFNAYMQSDSFDSDAFRPFFESTDLPTANGTPIHITFVAGVDSKMREEFTSMLRLAATSEQNWGKAGRVKRILRNYRDDNVVELTGTEKDLYDDLCRCFGYNQDIKSFYGAKPKLGKTKTKNS